MEISIVAVVLFQIVLLAAATGSLIKLVNKQNNR